MSNSYDLIVVGAGPAGLVAAWKAAARGLRVLLVEKKALIGEALRTTGNAFKNLAPINGEYVSVDRSGAKAVVHFHNSDFDIEYSGRVIETYNSYAFSNAGYCLQTSRSSRPMSYVYDMRVLLRDLERCAQDSGVEFLAGAIAVSAESTDRAVKVLVKTRGKKTWLDAKRLVAADGLNSRLAENLGLNRDRPVVLRGPVFETVFHGAQLPYPPGFAFMLGSDMLGGRGFLFVYPHASGENAFSVMANTRFPAQQPVRMINHFTKKSKRAEWFCHARPACSTEAIVTVRAPLKNPSCGNVLFIGDAAAYGETLVVGAMRCGYHAAEAVYDELAGANGFEKYANFWQSNFDFVNNPQKQKDYTKILRLYGSLADEELDLLFRLSEESGGIILSDDQPSANEYTGGNAVIDYFMGFSQVTGELREKLQAIRNQ